MLIILTPGFPENESDTTSMPPQQVFVKALKKKYPLLEIVIFSIHYPYFKSRYQYFGCQVISFGGKNKGLIRGWSLRNKIRETLQKLKNENEVIGLLSFWCGDVAWIGEKFAQKHTLKHFCWILGQDAKKENKFAKRFKPGRLIALSAFIQNEFEMNHGVRPAHVITPGIDPALYTQQPVEKDIDLLGAGSLVSLKQYEIFLDIIRELKNKIPSLMAKLCGKGPEEPKLRKLTKEWDLAPNFELMGELPHPDVLKLMQRTKIFLHPSSYEGFGVVCIEALHAGCHVISFLQPMKEPLPNWDIVKNKEEMARKTQDLLMDDNTIYKAVAPFLINDTADSIMRLYDYSEAAR